MNVDFGTKELSHLMPGKLDQVWCDEALVTVN